jgi:carboxylesterase type B
MFKCINDMTDLHRRHGTEPTFYYMYAHPGQYTLPTLLGVPPEINLGMTAYWKFRKEINSLFSGVCHADEIFLMFTNMVFPKIKNGEDKQVSKMLLDLWTSFAADG